MWTHFVVVGCGGIGGWLIPPLFREIEAYKRELGVKDGAVSVLAVDGDKVEQGNLLRQNFSTEHLGENKAQTFVPNRPYYEHEASYLSEENVGDLIPENSIVLAGPDNHACRRILAERCAELSDCCLIIGGNELTDGNVSCHLRERGENRTTAYRDRHPEVWDTEKDDRSEMSCDELSALPGGGQTLAANFMCAAIMLNAVRKVLNANLVMADDAPMSDVYFDVDTSQMGGTA